MKIFIKVYVKCLSTEYTKHKMFLTQFITVKKSSNVRSFLLKITEKRVMYSQRGKVETLFLHFSTSTPTAGPFHVSSNLKKTTTPKQKSADINARAVLLRLCACSVQVHNIKPSIRLSLYSKKKPL